MASTASLIRNPDSGYSVKTLSKNRPAAIVLPGNGNDSDDEEVSTPSKTPKAPKSMARGENKSEAEAPKSDDQEAEDDGFFKAKGKVKLEAGNGARGANNDDFDDE
ncbi:hypothetical protein D6C89_10655 [Aureobasidium pullulans]|nr:hypothetical protein D6C89_10655 [Aureobasidium pullulans]